MRIATAMKHIRRHAPRSLAVALSASVVWSWLERVHTARFIVEILQTPQARTAIRFAESREAQTLLLVVILVASVACWTKLRGMTGGRNLSNRRRAKGAASPRRRS